MIHKCKNQKIAYLSVLQKFLLKQGDPIPQMLSTNISAFEWNPICVFIISTSKVMIQNRSPHIRFETPLSFPLISQIIFEKWVANLARMARFPFLESFSKIATCRLISVKSFPIRFCFCCCEDSDWKWKEKRNPWSEVTLKIATQVAATSPRFRERTAP